MEENPSGSLPPAPFLPDETVRMARVLPLSAVGVTNDQPPEHWRTCPGGPVDCTCSPRTPAGRVRGVPLEDDPEADPPGWWDDVARRSASLEPIVLEPVEGTLLEVAGTDPFILWCQRILYASGVIAWLLVLVPIVRIVWSELWF